MAKLKITYDPPDLLRRMHRFPDKLQEMVADEAPGVMRDIQDATPPYPAEVPGQRYIRTGDLGASWGVNMQGQPLGQPDVFVSRINGNKMTTVYGSNLYYAPYVIGEGRRHKTFRDRWWTSLDVAKNAIGALVDRYNDVAKRMVRFLDGGI